MADLKPKELDSDQQSEGLQLRQSQQSHPGFESEPAVDNDSRPQSASQEEMQVTVKAPLTLKDCLVIQT